MQPPPSFGISTWSLHRAIGLWHPNAPGNDVPGGAVEKWGSGSLPLLELPAAARRFGADGIHLCHFHLASRDPIYLGELRAALADAGVALDMLLIDDGDITDPDHRPRDLAWIGRWIEAAAALGASAARVIAGKRLPTPQVLAASTAGLRELARFGTSVGVRVVTENWFDTLSRPEAVEAVLAALGGEVGFLIDFGNWKGPGKYRDLARVARFADDSHAKAHFDAGFAIDRADFGGCVDLMAAVGYAGRYTLIYDGPDDDEWRGLAVERDFIAGRLAAAARHIA